MDALKFLLNAPSQKVVEEIFLLGFKRRNDPMTEKEKKALIDLLQVKEEEAVNLLNSVSFVIREALYEGMSGEQIINFLPKDLHDKLKVLIAKIIVHHLPKWKENAITLQPSLPRLQDLDWRIDLTNSSDQMHRMNLPSLIVQLKIKENPQSIHDEPKISNINFEMTKSALDTVLEGLWQIRDQLSSLIPSSKESQ
jgi:hypothetical protein